MSVLNRAAAKKMILECARANRMGWDCQRVSAKALDELEIKIKCLIHTGVHQHPTIGKTFTGF